MIATQTGASCIGGGLKFFKGTFGCTLDRSVPALLAALAMAGLLGGCGDVGWDSATLFRKPIDVAGRNSGYTYSDLQESRQGRPVTDSDLVDASGSCPAAARRRQRPLVAQPAVPVSLAQARRRLARASVSA